ncbi:hypothetical protein DPMN_132709 [Dreissena polymorpha]|uniref:Uncharacterized protein n=1 Tax=Dreissena polymorpha TaxID=45954 RepID=A0A9D4JCA9_DREPO|nr:hypothetical protein DPMN_132709 [Dreissena polymorpha]
MAFHHFPLFSIKFSPFATLLHGKRWHLLEISGKSRDECLCLWNVPVQRAVLCVYSKKYIALEIVDQGKTVQVSGNRLAMCDYADICIPYLGAPGQDHKQVLIRLEIINFYEYQYYFEKT